MSLNFKKPLTPSQRGQVSLNTSDLQQKLSLEKTFIFSNLERNTIKNNRFLPSQESFSKTTFFFNEILEKKAQKLIKGKIKNGGRNNQGRITVRGRGGGHKQNYKFISFKRNNLPFQLMVYSIHQDPNRSANIAFLGPVFASDSCEQQATTLGSKSHKKFKNKLQFSSPMANNFFYILAPKNLEVGAIVKNEGYFQQRPLPKGDQLKGRNTFSFFKKEIEGSYAENPQLGDSMPLYKFPLGSQIHNLEIFPGQGGKLIRSAGNSGEIIEKSLEKGYARIKLPSGCQRWIPLTSRASLGVVGNEDHRQIVLGKAGASRWRGRRPKVRGVAMNPVDHPHGGGEGRTSGGRPSVTPWGRPTRSFRLHKRKINPFIILRSSPKKKPKVKLNFLQKIHS